MQCPNPDCNSYSIRAKPHTMPLDRGRGILTRLISSTGIWSAISVIFFLMIVLGSFLIRPVFGLAGTSGGIIISIVFLLAALVIPFLYFQKFSKTEKKTVTEIKCNRCGSSWYDSEVLPLPLVAKWKQGLENELAHQRRLGHKRGMAVYLLYSADYYLRYTTDVKTPRVMIDESLDILKDLQDENLREHAKNELGLVLTYNGEYKEAVGVLEESTAYIRKQKQWGALTRVLESLGSAVIGTGNYARAELIFEESLQLAEKMDDRETIAHDLEGLAECAALQGQWERAARLFAAAGKLRTYSGRIVPPMLGQRYGKSLSQIRAALGEHYFGQAWWQGEEMNLEQAIAYGLGKQAAPQPVPSA